MTNNNPIPKPDDTRLSQSLLDIEESIRFEPIEFLYVVKPQSGAIILSKSGDQDSIFLTDEECLLLEGNIITHNHPFDEYPISISFSEEDILAAAAHKAAEVRVVTPTDKFSIRPPQQGWNVDYCFNVLLPVIETAKARVEAQMSAEVQAGVMSEAEVSRSYCHRLWSLLAPQLGLTYESSFNLEQLRQTQPNSNQKPRISNELKGDNGNPTFRLMKASSNAGLVRLEVVKQLNDPNFLLLHRRVDEYFKTSPPHPPSQSDRQIVQTEVEILVIQINHLWQKQAKQVEIVEAMQKNPFRIWNSKYDVAVAQVRATTGLISQSITQKEQKEQQLKQWEKLDEVYQAWDKSPQTSQIRSFATVLNSPPMQERLANINQQRQQQKQVQLSQPGFNHKQQGDCGKGDHFKLR